MSSPSAAPSRPSAPRQFATTRWSLVLRAGRNDTPHAHAALEHLCRAYWYPLYAHARRRGHDAHEAEDLTQAFFARLLQKQTLERADPARGRFRTFILTALDHFLADEHDRTHAQRRGGNAPALDLTSAESRYALESTRYAPSPDRAFDREWALALLDTVLAQVEAEYRANGRSALFAALRPTLAGSRQTQPYGALAAQLGMTEANVKVAVHRLRQRYRACLRAEIAQTVAEPGEIEEEMRHLLRAVAD